MSETKAKQTNGAPWCVTIQRKKLDASFWRLAVISFSCVSFSLLSALAAENANADSAVKDFDMRKNETGTKIRGVIELALRIQGAAPEMGSCYIGRASFYDPVVVQSMGDGFYLCQLKDFNSHIDWERDCHEYFIVESGRQKIDGQKLSGEVLSYEGVKSYRTVLGAIKTVRLFKEIVGENARKSLADYEVRCEESSKKLKEQEAAAEVARKVERERKDMEKKEKAVANMKRKYKTPWRYCDPKRIIVAKSLRDFMSISHVPKQVEMSKCIENEDWEGLSKLFGQYEEFKKAGYIPRLANLPDPVLNLEWKGCPTNVRGLIVVRYDGCDGDGHVLVSDMCFQVGAKRIKFGKPASVLVIVPDYNGGMSNLESAWETSKLDIQRREAQQSGNADLARELEQKVELLKKGREAKDVRKRLSGLVNETELAIVKAREELADGEMTKEEFRAVLAKESQNLIDKYRKLAEEF